MPALEGAVRPADDADRGIEHEHNRLLFRLGWVEAKTTGFTSQRRCDVSAMRRGVTVGSLLLLALVIWAEWTPAPGNPKHPHCGQTTKWLLMQPSDFASLIDQSPRDPLRNWEVTSCFRSADDCNSYRLQEEKEWSEGEGSDLNDEPFFKELTDEYAVARCLSVTDPEVTEAVKRHGPFLFTDDEDG